MAILDQKMSEMEKREIINIEMEKLFKADNDKLRYYIDKLENMKLEDACAVTNVCVVCSNLAVLVTRGIENFKKMFNKKNKDGYELILDVTEDKKEKINKSIDAFEQFICKVGFAAVGIIDAGKFVYKTADSLAPEGMPFREQVHVAVRLLGKLQKILRKIFEVLAKLTTEAVNKPVRLIKDEEADTVKIRQIASFPLIHSVMSKFDGMSIFPNMPTLVAAASKAPAFTEAKPSW